jgi:hypothetical protein
MDQLIFVDLPFLTPVSFQKIRIWIAPSDISDEFLRLRQAP